MKKLIFLLLVIVSTVLHAQVNKRTGLLIDTLTTTELNSLNDKFKISGSLFYDDTLKSFVTYKNGGWASVGGSTYTAGDGLTLTGTEFSVNETFLNGVYLPLDGTGIMTGDLEMGSNDINDVITIVLETLVAQSDVITPNLTSNAINSSSLSGTGDRMVIANSSGTLSTQAIPSGGTDDQTASEVSITDSGSNFTSTDVEGALAELASLDDDAVEIRFNPYGSVTSTNVQLAMSEIIDEIDNASGGSSDITYDNTTSGLTATDVQDAIDEIAETNGIEWDAATSKTMQIDDANKIFYKSESDNGIKQFIIPLDSNASYDSDVAFTFNHEGGAGIIRVRGESGVNITPKRLNSLGTMSLIRRGIDNWVWVGAYEDDVNANPETYTLNNCLSTDTNTNSVDGLSNIYGTSHASVVNTSPSNVSYMWEITSTTVDESSRAREVFVVDNFKTYEVQFWVKGDINTSYRWENGTDDNTYRDGVITTEWQRITEVINTTSVNPTLSFYTNRLVGGSVGDKVYVAAYTMKELETGL